MSSKYVNKEHRGRYNSFINISKILGTVLASWIVVSLLLQIITITLIGKYSDKNLSKSNNLVTIIKTMITGIYLFARNKIIISLNNMLSDNFTKVYETSIQTSLSFGEF